MVLMATSDQRGLKEGYRSGLEELVAAQLAAAGIVFEYEAVRLGFTPPTKRKTYKPDFILPNGIVIETKGRFVTADRQKHRALKEEHPNLDIRFVFSRSRQFISKKSTTSYGDWCNRYQFLYADRLIPTEWLQEPYSSWAHHAIKLATV